ncbi:uncharacterized protein [Amphiura filiformis]|uniref:uncharacterized protein n=1 Tax=Amphiura filiformis TaxID=82378 RepID=UPI003B215FE3
MAIKYGCVAVGRSIIADRSRKTKQNFRAVVLSMLPNLATQQVMKVFDHERYKFAVLPDNGILCICAMSPDFSEEQSFEFLKEVVKIFPKHNFDDSVGDLGVTVVDDLYVKKIKQFAESLKKEMVN